MTTDTGGPAFPCHPGIENPLYDGMFLRDYFAASFISSGAVFKQLSSGDTPDQVAAQAYALADAMLKRRQA
jgi:hypothetical protein